MKEKDIDYLKISEECTDFLKVSEQYVELAIKAQEDIANGHECVNRKKTEVYLETAIDNITFYIWKTERVYTKEEQKTGKEILSRMRNAARDNQNKMEPEIMTVQLDEILQSLGYEICLLIDYL